MTELEKAAREATKMSSETSTSAGTGANYMHIYGFHEAKLDSEAVKQQISFIEKMVKTARQLITKN
ncbi:MAG: hypothetical protein QXW47_05160 [Candidatus Jordarchaeales archaeon]